MKKLLALIAVVLLSVGALQAKDRVSSDINVLPKNAQVLIKKHFSKVGVNHIKIDEDILGKKDYDVILDNGTEIEFDKNGNLKEIDCGNRAVPSALVLKPISQYVSKNFKGQKIVSVDVNRNDYKIELSNGVELKFDRVGNFLRIDD